MVSPTKNVHYTSISAKEYERDGSPKDRGIGTDAKKMSCATLVGHLILTT